MPNDTAQTSGGRLPLRDTRRAAGWELPQVVLTPTVTIPYPGVNGVRFAKGTNHLYYTNCAQQRFTRSPVDPQTWNPAGTPEMLEGDILSADDFCVDEAGAAMCGLETVRLTEIKSRRFGRRYAENSHNERGANMVNPSMI